MSTDRFDDDFDDEDDRPRRRGRRRDDEAFYEEEHRGGLILALGIIGLVVCPLVGIAAWLMGANDLRAMEEGRMDPEGKSNTQTGKILGIVSAVLVLLNVMVIVLMVGLMAVGGLK